MKMLVRPWLVLPHLRELPLPVLKRSDRLQAKFEEFKATATRCTANDIEWTLVTNPWREHRPELCHPLSAAWKATRVPEAGATRCAQTEFRAFGAHAQSLRLVFTKNRAQTPDRARLDDLCAAASGVLGQPTHIRNQAVVLAPDSTGMAIALCNWPEVPGRLHELISQYSESGLPLVMKALATYLCFLNIHPFQDGNGRTARALLNALLGADENNCYLPVKQATDASEGGYELRLREVEINNNWVPIMQYFATLMDIRRSQLERSLGECA